MKAIKLLLFICLCTFYSKTQAQDSLMVWQANKPLQWDDFRAPVDTTSTFQASTYTSVTYSYQWHRQKGVYTMKFKVYAWMHKNRSWTIPGKQTSPLLAHEQLHFDICELFARKLFAELSAQTYDDNYKTEIIRIAQEFGAQRKLFQIKYDEESSHSKNKAKQQEWELYIKQQLDLLRPVDR